MINAFVFDTNVLISAHILPSSISRKAFDKADHDGILVHSSETLREFANVFMRTKFDRYQSGEARLRMIAAFEKRSQLIKITESVSACRDRSDDMVLELAFSSHAKTIVTGDPDLKTLHPFRGIPILSPAEFLNWIGSK